MALPNYPNNPSVNDTFVNGGVTFQWDGEKWKALSNANNTLTAQLADPDSTVLIGGVEAKAVQKTFDNVGAMKSSSLSIGQCVRCKRYYAGGELVDGLVFNIVSASTGTDDGGSFHDLANGNQAQLITNGSVNVKQFGARGNGSTDDSSAFQNAIDYASVVTADNQQYLISNSIIVSSKLTFQSPCTIIPRIGLSGGNVFYLTTNDVHLENIVFDATGSTFTPATGNTYIIRSGDGNTKYYNHSVKNCKFKTLSFSDGNTGVSNLLVTQAVYIDNVDNVAVQNNEFDTISGASVFVRDCKNLTIKDNSITDSIWYPIHIVGGADNFEISGNRIISNISQGIFYGGAIDLMSQQTPLETRNKNGVIFNNYVTGKISYGSCFRIFSCENVSVFGNVIENVSVGTVALGNTLTGIRVDTRGISAGVENSPVRNINIYNNTLVSGATSTNEHYGIYVSNQWQTARDTAQYIKIYNNEIVSNDTSNYWESGIVFNGNEGGIEDVYVENNKVVVYMQASPIVDGAIGFVSANAQGSINRVYIGGNYVRDLGTPASSYQLGIGYGAYVNDVYQTAPNYIDNFFYGVRTFTNSGTVLDRIDDNNYDNIGSLNELFSVNPSRYGLYLEASTTYDPPSLTSGSTTSTDIAVTGASVGDRVEATFSVNQDGVIFTGYVRAANSVRVYLENKETTTKDLASGTLTVRVIR